MTQLKEGRCLISWMIRKSLTRRKLLLLCLALTLFSHWNKEVMPRQEEAILWEWEEHEEGLYVKDSEAGRHKPLGSWWRCGITGSWLHQPWRAYPQALQETTPCSPTLHWSSLISELNIPLTYHLLNFLRKSQPATPGSKVGNKLFSLFFSFLLAGMYILQIKKSSRTE